MRKADMKKKGRITACLILLSFLLFLPVLRVRAEEAAIRSIDVHVLLQDDGTAEITQVWDVTVTGGTEYYIPQTNLSDMRIEDLRVSDERGKEYLFEEEWDLDRSLEEKANRCGLHGTDEGVEICWGVGSYGDHVFTVKYRLTNLVKAYSDFDGFNSRFINDDLSSPVERARVSIEKQGHRFTPEEVRMWAFGFDGEIALEEGIIVARNKSRLHSRDHVTVMTSYVKGLFSPSSQKEGSFETLRQRAFEGSDYESDGMGIAETIGRFTRNFFIFVMGFVGIAIVALLFFGKKLSYLSPVEGKLRDKKEVDYFRKPPMEGDYTACIGALSNVETLSEKNILAMYLLKWIRDGVLEIQEVAEKGLFSGKSKNGLRVNFDRKIDVPNERKLFKMISEAAGKNQILEEREFRTWSQKNYSILSNWFYVEKEEGKERFDQLGGTEFAEKKRLIGNSFVRRKVLSRSGVQMIEEIRGFQRYLEDFTLIAERESIEVALWEEYLIFAALFGVAEKVSRELKALYPDFVQHSAYGGYTEGDSFMQTVLMVNNISRAGQSGISAGRNESSGGGGGFSSSGGGGGFSGGGSGGGSR